MELAAILPPITNNVTDVRDAELIDRMAAGDREAFALLFRRHQATVYRFSRQMLGSKDAAEDVTQDVFVALAETGHRFDPARGSLTTYLYGIARHLILQRHRRVRRRIEVDIGALSAEDVEALSTATDPIEALARAQLLEHVRTAIVKLPVHYREVLVLCELHGLSYEDAAAVAKCPIGTVRSRLSRARQMLIERCANRVDPDAIERQTPRGGRKLWLIPTKSDC
jgi:RNA polymerase sigma-70 factor, ECF subfamily